MKKRREEMRREEKITLESRERGGVAIVLLPFVLFYFSFNFSRSVCFSL
jgi:hypothetical protein